MVGFVVPNIQVLFLVVGGVAPTVRVVTVMLPGMGCDVVPGVVVTPELGGFGAVVGVKPGIRSEGKVEVDELALPS